MLDTSAGLGNEDFEAGIGAITYLTNMITERDRNNSVRMSLTTFGKSVKVLRDFSDTSDKHSILSLVQSLTLAEGRCMRLQESETGFQSCWSSAAEAKFPEAVALLQSEMFNVENNATREILIILTNGRFDVTEDAKQALAELKNNKVLVVVVAVGDDVNMENLHLLVNDPAYIFAARFEETPTNLEVLSAEIFYSSCDLSNDF